MATAPAAGGSKSEHAVATHLYLSARRPSARAAPGSSSCSSVSVHVPPASLLPRNYFARPVAPSIIKHQPPQGSRALQLSSGWLLAANDAVRVLLVRKKHALLPAEDLPRILLLLA